MMLRGCIAHPGYSCPNCLRVAHTSTLKDKEKPALHTVWSCRKPLFLRVQGECPGELYHVGRGLFCPLVRLLTKAPVTALMPVSDGKRLGKEQLLDCQLDQGCSKVTLVPFKHKTDFPMLSDDPERSQNYESYLVSFS